MAKRLGCSLVFALGIFWMLSVPVTIVGFSMGGKELLSLVRLSADLGEGDSYALTRIWAWFMVLFPFAALALLFKIFR